MSLSQSLVCDKCKSLLDRVRQLMEELEAVRRSLLENLEQKLSVNCRVTDVGGRNWQDCIDGLLTNMKEQNWRKNVTNLSVQIIDLKIMSKPFWIQDFDSSESEEGSVQLLIAENERKALPINGVSVMPVSQLIQSASWFHRRSSHDSRSVAVFLSPGVSSTTDLHNKSHELGRKGTSCSTCRKTFDKFSDIMAHCEKPCGKNDTKKKVSSSSSSSSAKEYVCDICSKRFSRKAYLIEHQVGSLTRFLKRLMRIMMTNAHFIGCYFFKLVCHTLKVEPTPKCVHRHATEGRKIVSARFVTNGSTAPPTGDT